MRVYPILISIIIATIYTYAFAIDSDLYRLLSVANTNKLILVSQIPNKTKYVLDASAAKITVDGKPAELKNLALFSRAHIKFELKKSTKDGIDVDGVATEIKIMLEDNK